MIVQIYDITSPEEALKLCEVGVDNIGVVVGHGNYINEVRPMRAREIFLSLPNNNSGVALTVSSEVEEIKKFIAESEPDILHLAAPPSEVLPQHIRQIKQDFPDISIMRTVPVVGEESVATALVYDNECDYLLLDTKDVLSGRIGITGKTHNWDISKKIVEEASSKIILAGGLGPGNVEEAIQKVNPFGVDSKTRTDTDDGRRKDIMKVKEFVKRAISVKI
jgi:phosphoribosylanthranilate isomerase